jgi:hypothetical protein
MTGAAIAIDNASAADTIINLKKRVYATNHKMPVRRQRLMYTTGPYGMDPLADDETLGGAGVARDGSAKLDVLLADLTAEEVDALGPKVPFLVRWYLICERLRLRPCPYLNDVFCGASLGR